MTASLRVLLVEDCEADAKLVLRALERGWPDLHSERVETEEALQRALAESSWDIVVSDWSLPQFDALEALATLQRSGHDIPFIIASGTIGEETAVEALRAGARDFVLKHRLARLVPAVERELAEHERRRSHARAEAALRDSEQQLRHTQKMEALGSLAGGVAHDFNNLLSVILSYTGVALAELPADAPLREDLAEVHRAGERAAELTQQLLAFSRRQLLRPRLLDLGDVVGGVEKMLRRLLGEDIELVLERAAPVGHSLLDRGQIEQVIMNLAVNARDAMPRGGKLAIVVKSVVLDEAFVATHVGANPGPHVMLAVRDDGSGMDAETRARIFEPFFTTKDLHGTGLGLPTVLGIVHQSGGTIWVTSAPGEGTSFELYFPEAAAVSAVGEEELARERDRVDGDETILLVEDDLQVRTLASTLLRRHGYHVLEAQSGGDALLLSEQHDAAIDLMLTDVVMPRLSGHELAERLRCTRPGLRTLYMSGYTDDAVIRHGVFEANVAFLQKPFTADSLVRKVRETLDELACDLAANAGA